MKTKVSALAGLALIIASISCSTFNKKTDAAVVKPSDPLEIYTTTPAETNLSVTGLRDAQTVWLEQISQTKTSIDLSHFYIAGTPGEALDPVIAALKAAGERGVKIRFLQSKELLSEGKEALTAVKAIPNLEHRIIDFTKVPGAGGILHTKYMIFDGARSMIGSQNFDWRALSQIQETGIRIDDLQTAMALRAVFDMDWAIAGGQRFKNHSGKPRPFAGPGWELVVSPITLLPNGARPAITALLELVDQSRSTLKLQALDYSHKSRKNEAEWMELKDALVRAAGRGVKVQLMVSNWNTRKPGIDHLKSLSQTPGIEIKIVSIPVASSGFVPFSRVIHTKQIIADSSTYWIGTSNLSKDYFYFSRNVEFIAKNRRLADQGEQIFKKIWESTYAEELDPLKNYPEFDPSKP